jgi:hypothetical protein
MDQNKQDLVAKLQNINAKLIELFGGEYDYVNNQNELYSQQSSIPKIIHKTYINHCTCPWWSWHTHHHCTKSHKSKKDDENESGHYMLGTMIMGGVSLFGTYMFVTDKYMKFLRAKLTCDLNDIMETNQSFGQFNDVNDAVDKCKTWMQTYKSRTRPSLWSKVGMTLSGLIMGLGVFTGSSQTTMMGFWFGIISSCSMIWNYADPLTTHNKNKERNEFNNAINGLHTAINSCQMIIPSAPPLYETYHD